MLIYRKILYLLFCLIFINQNAYCAVVLSPEMKAYMRQTVETPGVLHIIIALILVIALMYVTSGIYMKLNLINKKSFSKLDKQLGELNKFKIISTLPLGQNRNIHIIEVNNKYLMIGSTSSNISLIKEFDKADLLKVMKSAEDFVQTQTEQKEIDIPEALSVIYPHSDENNENEVKEEENRQENSEVEKENDFQDEEFDKIYKKRSEEHTSE